MDNKDFLYQLIAVTIYVTPIATLIWKAAQQASKIKEIDKKVNSLELRVNSDIAEIKKAVSSINVSIAEIKTAIEYIKGGN